MENDNKINPPVQKEWVTPKTWTEFRSTGLLLFINQIMHAFGWAFVVEVDKASGEVTKCYPARVKFRGFDEKSQEEEHIKIADYLAKEAPKFPEEIKD